ncbi:hypothetical protein D3C71_1795520 [compost metagenome]
MAADVVAHRRDQQAKNERHAPAPALQLRLRQRSIEHRAEQCGKQDRRPLAGDLPTCVVGAPVWRILDEERSRAAKLPARRKTLYEAGDQDDH